MVQASYNIDSNSLPSRIDPELILKRRQAEEVFWKLTSRKNFMCRHRKKILGTLDLALKGSGLYSLGYREYINIEQIFNDVYIENLPTEFEGFRILQLSDTHIDLSPDIADATIEAIKDLDYDLCVHTGDFMDIAIADIQTTVHSTRKIREHIKTDIYAVFGNHDTLALINPIEEAGIHLLFNEHVRIEKDKKEIYLAGIDDPFLYNTDDIAASAKGIPDGAISILLAHSPQVYDEASSHHFNLMLSGHTHGGQICLPGEIPLINNCNSPMKIVAGSWRVGNLQGYTSKGTGSCGRPIRFFCRPEVTIHCLRRL